MLKIKLRDKSECYYGIDSDLYKRDNQSDVLKIKKNIILVLLLVLVITSITSVINVTRVEKQTAVIADDDSKIEEIVDSNQIESVDDSPDDAADDLPGIYGYDDETLSVDIPEISQEFVDINEYSRIGQLLDTVDNIVVHYVGNPGTTAAQNRSYYQELKLTQETKASSNFVVGLEGEIIETVPMYEVAYASNQLNRTSISIETCHHTEAGNFSNDTMESLVHLCAWLCAKYGLEATDVIRHYDITGKNCPLYYVENQSAWDDFIKQVELKMN